MKSSERCSSPVASRGASSTDQPWPMERAFLRVVALAQVLRVTPSDPATQRVTAQQGGHDRGLWEFDSQAVGAIGDQSKLHASDRLS